MPRNISSTNLTALEQPILYPAVFVQMTFTGGVENLWTGVGPITLSTGTFQGVGSLLSVSVAEEVAKVEAKGIAIGLSGLDITTVNNVFNTFMLGSPVTVWLGNFDGTGFYTSGHLVDAPFIAWAGNMDVPELVMNGAQVSLTIQCESRLLDMNQSVELRYTAQQIQLENPQDVGGQWINGLQQLTLAWGSAGQGNSGLNI